MGILITAFSADNRLMRHSLTLIYALRPFAFPGLFQGKNSTVCIDCMINGGDKELYIIACRSSKAQKADLLLEEKARKLIIDLWMVL